MSTTSIIEKLSALHIVPAIVISDAKKALQAAEALCEGGIPCAEVSFRNDSAEEAIRMIKREFPSMTIGAGNVLNCEQIRAAADAGAEFAASPGLNPKTADCCGKLGLQYIPGVCTPTDVESALSLGIYAMKFFPADASGGVKMLKAISSPFPTVRFMPTGGIVPTNLESYLKCKSVFACGGSWIAAPDMIKKGEFDEIKQRAADAVKLLKEIPV